jgi:hypothetical protein
MGQEHKGARPRLGETRHMTAGAEDKDWQSCSHAVMSLGRGKHLLVRQQLR